MRASASIVIERPIREVFALVTDVAYLDQWMEEVEDPQVLSDGRVGLGSAFTANHGRQAASVTYQVTVFDPPHRFAFKAVDGPLAFVHRPRRDDAGPPHRGDPVGAHRREAGGGMVRPAAADAAASAAPAKPRGPAPPPDAAGTGPDLHVPAEFAGGLTDRPYAALTRSGDLRSASTEKSQISAQPPPTSHHCVSSGTATLMA